MPPERSQSPVGSESETEADPPQSQDSLNSGSGSNGTPHNEADRAVTEFDSIVAMYNVPPSTVNGARTFVQVSVSQLSSSSWLNAICSFVQDLNSCICTSVFKRSGQQSLHQVTLRNLFHLSLRYVAVPSITHTCERPNTGEHQGVCQSSSRRAENHIV